MEREISHPDQLLKDSFKKYRHLTPLDRAFLTELIYGILRWREKLDFSIRYFSKLPFEKIELPTLNLLRLGLYQIQFLTRTPVSAAVNESVELAKRVRGSGGGGFVNAILRSYLRRREELVYPKIEEDPALHLSIVQSYPLWLVRRWIEEVGVEGALRVCILNNQIPSLTLRTNTLKISREELIERLREKGLKAAPAHYSAEGVYLEDTLPVSELPFLNEGFFIIQDEGSQLVTSVLDPKPGEVILDGCAAPGGKTTHIGQRMKNRGKIYALDLTREKLSLIEEMCKRLGVVNVKRLKGDVTRSLPALQGVKFDRILADVPCSGFGTLRRNPDLKWRRAEEDIRRLSQLQLQILDNLSEYVKERGVLVYSTCTIFREENEEVVEHFLKDHPEFQLEPVSNLLPERLRPLIQKEWLKTFPPGDGMDGFFIARMRKRSSKEEIS